MSNIARIKKRDIANGEGIRTSVFFSGCTHHCKGCFNQEAWDYDYGVRFNINTYKEIYETSNHKYIKGLSIIGGEPFDKKNVMSVYLVISLFKRDFPDKDIWVWSGYTWDELISYRENEGYFTRLALSKIDVLIDGRYEEDKRDLTLKHRGSSNQRVIDVQESLKQNKVVLYERNDK